MAALALHTLALALFDACESYGVRLEVLDVGLVASGRPDDAALASRLVAFCGAGEHRQSLASYRALRDIARAPSRAARELLATSVAVLALPVPYTLTFTRGGHRCVGTSSRAVYEAAVRDGVAAFALKELVAVAAAVELGRASPVDLDRWIAIKQRGSWVLTPELAGVDVPVEPGRTPSLCVGELLDALGAELVDVELHGEAA
jgi:hypothetical protein